jgi:hypothetical protein
MPRLRDMISADAVDIAASLGVAHQGRDAILNAARHQERNGSPNKLKAITEAVTTETLKLPGGPTLERQSSPEAWIRSVTRSRLEPRCA